RVWSMTSTPAWWRSSPRPPRHKTNRPCRRPAVTQGSLSACHRRDFQFVELHMEVASDGLEPSTPSYEEGLWRQVGVVHRPVMAGVGVVGVELGSSLYRLLGEEKADWSSLRWRISLRAVRWPGGRWRLWERSVGRG